MLSINYLKEHKEEAIELLAVKNFDAKELIEEAIATDSKRREAQKKRDDILAESKKMAKEIGRLFSQGKAEEANAIKEKTAQFKQDSKSLDEEYQSSSTKLRDILLQIPNIPHQSVPAGNNENDNQEVSRLGDIPELNKEALPHWELAKKYNIIDFDLGSKVSGAGFPFYRAAGARLQRALINFFLDNAIAAGYEEYQPPLVVNEESGYGTGQLPDKDGQMYYINEDNLYLIPTAEVPVTNIYRDVILQEKDLPVKNVAYSNCFRREAGSYGKDVRGLNRLHQFDKVEIVQITRPEDSYKALDEMTAYVGGLLKKLELPFRVLRLCGGDLSFTSALTFDFEVFSAAQKRWLEVSSVSNFESFQSNRMKLRYKNNEGKTQTAHTLNGSALALPRIVAALLENNQESDGIRMPEALRPYTGFNYIS